MFIRPFIEEDFAAFVENHNANWPDNQTSLEEALLMEQRRRKDLFCQRFVLEIDEKVVASGIIKQLEFRLQPGLLAILLTVHPDYQGKGVGKTLYYFLEDRAKENNATILSANVREDRLRAVKFTQNCGFEEEWREFSSYLDVQDFDFSPYEGVITAVEADGYQLKTLKELENDPNYKQKLYELDILLSEDVPSPVPLTPATFERFEEDTFHDPCLLPEAYFIAVHGEKYVGMSALWTSQGDQHLHTGLTGVVREHRRRKIALALKLKGIQYAKKHEIEKIYTFNNTINRPMLSINDALGFIKQFANVLMIKNLVD